MNIGHRIKQLRELKNLTQEELGKIIGVNKATINRYETGIIDIKRTTAIKLANVFGVTPAYIVGWEERNIDKSTAEYILNQNEIELIEIYRSLNKLGKNKVVEYISDISEQSKYTSNNNIADDIMNELKQIADERMQTLTPHTK